MAAALDTEDGADRIRQGVAKLMIQGQATVGAAGAIEPDFVAANLRRDLEASKAVFSVLQVRQPTRSIQKWSCIMAHSRDALRHKCAACG